MGTQTSSAPSSPDYSGGGRAAAITKRLSSAGDLPDYMLGFLCSPARPPQSPLVFSNDPEIKGALKRSARCRTWAAMAACITGLWSNVVTRAPQAYQPDGKRRNSPAARSPRRSPKRAHGLVAAQRRWWPARRVEGRCRCVIRPRRWGSVPATTISLMPADEGSRPTRCSGSLAEGLGGAQQDAQALGWPATGRPSRKVRQAERMGSLLG